MYDGGFVGCRTPAPNPGAFDSEMRSAWSSEDGFDDGLHSELRRNAPGLDGALDPACLDSNWFDSSARIDADGTAAGDVSETCETDIPLTVGAWTYDP